MCKILLNYKFQQISTNLSVLPMNMFPKSITKIVQKDFFFFCKGSTGQKNDFLIFILICRVMILVIFW